MLAALAKNGDHGCLGNGHDGLSEKMEPVGGCQRDAGQDGGAVTAQRTESVAGSARTANGWQSACIASARWSAAGSVRSVLPASRPEVGAMNNVAWSCVGVMQILVVRFVGCGCEAVPAWHHLRMGC